LASGHPERGDAFGVRAAVARAAMRMETRAREESAWFEYAAARRDADMKKKKETAKTAARVRREAAREETRGVSETPSSMDAFLEKPDRAHREPNGPNGEGDEGDERDEVAHRDARGTERRTRDGFGVNPIVA
jgi:hypothetical protein